MTSDFYDVIHLIAIRGGSNAPIEGHFGSFFGKFEPQNVVDYGVDPKKARPCVTMRVLSHCALKSIHDSLQ